MRIPQNILVVAALVTVGLSAWGQQATQQSTSTLAAQAVCADRGQHLYANEKHNPLDQSHADSFYSHYNAQLDKCIYETVTATSLSLSISVTDAFEGTNLAGYTW
jgi:hypothetical protein